jgi:NOL1/NOP2/fmu family ribosome biogenesis protein
VDPLDEFPELSPGRPEWVDGDQSLTGTRRAWPHKIKGYGHFIARLKDSREPMARLPVPMERTSPPADFQEWESENLNQAYTGCFLERKGKLYLCPGQLPAQARNQLRSPLPGLYLGDMKKNRFEPSHALAMSIRAQDAKRAVNFSRDDAQALKYLRGDTILQASDQKGWTLVTIDDFPVGWAKQTGKHLKNKIPSGWKYD